MVRRHNKRVHTGKDCHTGCRIPNRSEHDKKVKTRSIGTGKGSFLSKIPEAYKKPLQLHRRGLG